MTKYSYQFLFFLNCRKYYSAYRQFIKYKTTFVLNIKKFENKNFENFKMAIKNQKIDFDKNRVLTLTV